MRDEHLAGCGDVDLSTQNSFNDQILDLAHEHWHTERQASAYLNIFPLSCQTWALTKASKPFSSHHLLLFSITSFASKRTVSQEKTTLLFQKREREQNVLKANTMSLRENFLLERMKIFFLPSHIIYFHHQFCICLRRFVRGCNILKSKCKVSQKEKLFFQVEFK